MKSSYLFSQEDVVKNLLQSNKDLRNSDSLLYLEVIKRFGYDTSKTVSYYFSHNSEFPSYDSVSRTRRKVQEMYPELCADVRVKKIRRLNQSEYEKYATHNEKK